MPLTDEPWVLPGLLNELNPEQQAAVQAPLNQGVQVLAGAGTGKTRVISHRFVSALMHCMAQWPRQPVEDSNDHQPTVLAVTFTVKAANEMTERINTLLDEHHIPPPPSLWVHNFHGYGQRLLRQYGHYQGWDSTFRVMDADEQQTFLAQVLSDWETGQLNDAEAACQWAQLPVSPQAVENIPDSAKSDWLHWIRSFPHVLNRAKSAGLTPFDLFTHIRKQTRAFSQHLEAHPCQIDDTIETNHALINLYANHWKPWIKNPTAWWGTPDEHAAFIAHRSATLKRGDPTDLEPFYGKQLEWLNKQWQWLQHGQPCQPLPRKVRNTMQPGDYVSLAELSRVHGLEEDLINTLSILYAVYQYRLFQQHRCDFDDLILQPLQLLKTVPAVQAAVHRQFALVIVDEFQDTNASQLALIQATCRANETNLTVVGDIKQSIYGFRDAQPDNMHWVFNQRSTVKQIQLTKNYRSQQPIVALANGITRTLQLDDTQPLTAQSTPSLQTPGSPVVDVFLAPSPQSEKTPSINTIRTAEAKWMVHEIQRLHQTQGVPYHHIALLVKDHAKAQRWASALHQANVPSSRPPSLAEWLNTPTVKNIRALMGILASPRNNTHWVRLLQNKLSPRQLRQLAKAAKDWADSTTPQPPSPGHSGPWVEVLLQLGDTRWCPDWPLPVREAVLDATQRILSARAVLSRRAWVPLTLVLATTLGLLKDSSDTELPPNGLLLPTALHIERWLTELSTAKATRHLSLMALCQWIDDQASHSGNTSLPETLVPSNVAPMQGAVQILTIHAAKGLEFPVVFVSCTDSFRRQARDTWVDLDSQYPHHLLGAHPSQPPGFGLYLTKHHQFWSPSGSMATLKRRLVEHLWLKPRAEAEAQRLFYVAVTRAQERLYLLRSTQTPAWMAPEHLLPPHELEDYVTSTHVVL
ncbi:MAG: ATP-dependent helicase [Vampirovibrionales bacterium]